MDLLRVTNIRIFLFFTQLSQLIGQPDSRFRPFDWVLYRGAGSISSITEGYTFAYIGTKMGGLKRFNLYSNNFEEPIFTFLKGIGISQIIHIPNNFYRLWNNNFIVASLNAGSIFRLKFDKEFSKAVYYEKIFINFGF